jgi:NADPH2:quinone reductase
VRAWQVNGVGEPEDVLEIVGRDRPIPGAGQVRLRVAAAAIGLPDLLMCRGTYPLTPPLPFIPGQEVSGVVTAVGDGVDSDLIGSRIMGVTAFYAGWGGFGTETVAAAQTVYRAPEEITDVDAAAFYIPFQTAWIALNRRAQVSAGQTVLVLGGAGGSGAAAIQVAAALGARVIGVAGNPAKAEFCRRMGAASVVDHSSAEIGKAVLELTDGRGVDVIFDPVGGEPARSAMGAMANEGQLLLVGFASGKWAELDAADLVHRNYSAVGIYAGAYDRGYSEEAHDRLLELWDQGQIRSLVTETVGFEELPQALAELATRASIGRVVMTIT